MNRLLWWTTYTSCGVLSLFFLAFGVSLCRAAYRLKDPYHFILTFFASNFIILISAVIFIAVAVRVLGRLRGHRPTNDDNHHEHQDSS